MPGSKLFPYIYNSNKPGTKLAIPQVDTTPHGVETPTPLWLIAKPHPEVRRASAARGG